MKPGAVRAAVRGASRSLESARCALLAERATGGAQAAPAGSAAVYQRLVDGRRFKCTQCGVCCTGAGDVWVNRADAARLATHLAIPERDFVHLFTEGEQRRGWWTLRSVGEARACVFLGSDNACSVHGAKPLQCTTYPWWPELMDDARWRSEREGICEGMDHAEASACDAAEAGRQLALATGHFAARDATPLHAPRGRRRSA